MTPTAQHVPDDERAHGLGATGGLPGANADPRASLLTQDELESTVDRGDVADVDSGLEPEGEAYRVDPSDPDVSGHMGDGIGGVAPSTDPMVDGRTADGRPAPGPDGAAG